MYISKTLNRTTYMWNPLCSRVHMHPEFKNKFWNSKNFKLKFRASIFVFHVLTKLFRGKSIIFVACVKIQIKSHEKPYVSTNCFLFLQEPHKMSVLCGRTLWTHKVLRYILCNIFWHFPMRLTCILNKGCISTWEPPLCKCMLYSYAK